MRDKNTLNKKSRAIKQSACICIVVLFGAFMSLCAQKMNNEEWSAAYSLCTEDKQLEACALLISEGLESVQKCSKSCNEIGMIFHSAGLRTQAIQYYLKAGLNGNMHGVHNIAIMLHEEEEFSEAAKYYTIACNNGTMLSCNNLGILHTNGLGVPRDLAKARALYTLACDNKESLACYNLGRMYGLGIGTNINVLLARSYFGKSCDLGYQAACEINADSLRPEDLRGLEQERGNEIRGLEI